MKSLIVAAALLALTGDSASAQCYWDGYRTVCPPSCWWDGFRTVCSGEGWRSPHWGWWHHDRGEWRGHEERHERWRH